MKYIGIRYATAARMGRPLAEPDLQNVNDITCRKVACPQSLSRLVRVMGDNPSQIEQSEDCLRLSIFTPAATTKLPSEPPIAWSCP